MVSTFPATHTVQGNYRHLLVAIGFVWPVKSTTLICVCLHFVLVGLAHEN